MKMIYQLLLQLFTKHNTSETSSEKILSFFDFSPEEQIRIMKAAGKNAQKKQQLLLKRYDARFGNSV